MKTNPHSSASLFKYPNGLVSSTIKHAVSSAILVEFYSFKHSPGEYAGGIAGVQSTCAHCVSLCCLHTMESGLIRCTQYEAHRSDPPKVVARVLSIFRSTLQQIEVGAAGTSSFTNRTGLVVLRARQYREQKQGRDAPNVPRNPSPMIFTREGAYLLVRFRSR
ncbi:hypothetical protein BDR07DRAFT_1406808 [Suillus spraguei]|nr:hypothetical protein BDR07DRAFT_1406808 [Suillus spraguei]